jgi:hypothetical protein
MRIIEAYLVGCVGDAMSEREKASHEKRFNEVDWRKVATGLGKRAHLVIGCRLAASFDPTWVHPALFGECILLFISDDECAEYASDGVDVFILDGLTVIGHQEIRADYLRQSLAHREALLRQRTVGLNG